MKEQTQDFARLVDLQREHTEQANLLEQLEVQVNKNNAKAVALLAADYVVIQERLVELEGQIRALFEQHPEWRKGQKSVTTPFGSVEQRSATALEIPNEAMTVALLKARGLAEPGFKAAAFIFTEEFPNREALAALPDAELALLGVNRKTTERITVKPARVDVARAVKAAKLAAN